MFKRQSILKDKPSRPTPKASQHVEKVILCLYYSIKRS